MLISLIMVMISPRTPIYQNINSYTLNIHNFCLSSLNKGGNIKKQCLMFKYTAAICSHVYAVKVQKLNLCFLCSSLRNISPMDAYQNICAHLGGYETLTHLTLEGNDQNDVLPTLCEILRHPKCNLQYLRYSSPSPRTLSMQRQLSHTSAVILQ